MQGDDVDIRVLAASIDQPIVTRDKLSFNATHTFAEMPDIDVLWVPDGNPPELAKLMSDRAPGSYLDFLIDRAGRAKWVCSVCEGALLLAAAGLLDGYRATTHWMFLPGLKSFDKIKVAPGFPRFIHDRNRLTGGGISSGLDESLELVRLLEGDEVACGVQRTLQYYPKPRFPEDLVAPSSCQFPGLSQPH
jgi:cyclohexyl-isocyanide hydratase